MPGRPPRDSRGRRKAEKLPLPVWQESLLLLGLALLLAMVTKTFFLQAFYIPSGSMEDTLRVDDRILVQKPSYWFGEPERGDVVVFSDPGGWLSPADTPGPSNVFTKTLEVFGLYPTGGHLVKRVIAVGGDSVRCCDKRGRIRVNGEPLEEDYLKEGVEPSLVTFDQKVPAGHLWLQGDNRRASSDSRYRLGDPGGGMVPVDDVVGKVFVVVWPFDHAGFVTRPDAFDELEDAAGDASGEAR